MFKAELLKDTSDLKTILSAHHYYYLRTTSYVEQSRYTVVLVASVSASMCVCVSVCPHKTTEQKLE